MTRDAKTPRDRIIAAIALVLRAVTKKDTHGRARRKLGTLNRRKKDKADTTKSPQMAVRRNTRMKTLKWGNASKNYGRCAVDKID